MDEGTKSSRGRILQDTSKVLESFDQIGDSFAKDYLKTYYSDSEPTIDEKYVLEFCVQQFKRLQVGCTVLELGCGPTIHHALPVAPYVDGIHFADYLQGCLNEISSWKNNAPQSHDWRVFTKFVLELEGKDNDEQSIRKREESLRNKIASIERCDVRQPESLLPNRYFDAVLCFYTPEQAVMATQDTPQHVRLDVWHTIMNHVCAKVRQGGYLFMAAVRGSDHYVTYDKATGVPIKHPLPILYEDNFADALRNNGFDLSDTLIEQRSLIGQEAEGLTSIILVAARKQGNQ